MVIYSQNILDHVKQSATHTLKTASKGNNSKSSRGNSSFRCQ